MKQLSTFSSRTVWACATAGALLLLSAQASAQTAAPISALEAPADPAEYSVTPLLQRYPADSIQSEDAAKDALKEVDAARAHIDARYALEQRACYPKFFTTSCLDKATERRRKDLAVVRPIEVEANAYMRKARVVERDRKLAEKAAENEADAAQRMQQSQQQDGAARNESEDQHDAMSKEAQRKKRAEDAARKQADYAAREQERKAHAAKDAQERAENVEKYNKKVREAEMRQQEVAKKKAQREHERAVKAAKEAKEQEKAGIVPAP
ncbi:MAG TPA: hypothetical protein VL528_06510 [Oxalicibacterium sp.]|nr:hypothetical protein [Oxalicibacterium sp.]